MVRIIPLFLPASACQHHGRDGTFFLYRTGERGSRQTLPNLREDKHRLCRDGEIEGNLYLASRVQLERPRQLGQPPHLASTG